MTAQVWGLSVNTLINTVGRDSSLSVAVMETGPPRSGRQPTVNTCLLESTNSAVFIKDLSHSPLFNPETPWP